MQTSSYPSPWRRPQFGPVVALYCGCYQKSKFQTKNFNSIKTWQNYSTLYWGIAIKITHGKICSVFVTQYVYHLETHRLCKGSATLFLKEWLIRKKKTLWPGNELTPLTDKLCCFKFCSRSEYSIIVAISLCCKDILGRKNVTRFLWWLCSLGFQSLALCPSSFQVINIFIYNTHITYMCLYCNIWKLEIHVCFTFYHDQGNKDKKRKKKNKEQTCYKVVV